VAIGRHYRTAASSPAARAYLAIEGFNQPQGAEWLAGKARQLTGKWPTHVVLTHYHADHANGVAGYQSGGHPALAPRSARASSS
jgi:glyoxylase-like metal-dependent hydrolase (beta-lactamase superfamily II)